METKGMKNRYTCHLCGGMIITINADDGVTSAALKCYATRNCKGLMESSWYNIDQTLEPTYEWYKPDTMAVLTAEVFDHVKEGGLLIRPIVKVDIFTFNDPTNPRHYHRIGRIEGMPFYWQNEVTGIMSTAVHAFLNHHPTPAQVELVIKYIQHHIHAPCWIETRGDEPDEENIQAIKSLREISMKLLTEADIKNYINLSMEIGMDPL